MTGAASGVLRPSGFHRLPVAEPEALAEILAVLLGAGPRVAKRREIWWWRSVRIHLDEVEGRGRFVELEARIDRIGCRREAALRLEDLRGRLGLADSDIVNGSYGEMP